MIRLWDYIEGMKLEKDDILDAISDVLDSGKIILGDQVETFEKEFARYCGSEFGIGVANGTDAIFLSLKSLDIGEGDEVITVSNTASPTVSAITATGAIPVLVDIDPNTYLMDIGLIEQSITESTKAIVAVHLYGQMVDMTSLVPIANKNNLFLIEDCAQSHSSMHKEKKAGSFGDVNAFSFYPTKNLGTYGDGGMCLTKSKNLNEKIRRLRYYGMEESYYSLHQGYNSRLDEIHAAILRKKLSKLDLSIKKRRKIADIYQSELKDTSLILPETQSENFHTYHLYVVQSVHREKLIKFLKDREILVGVHYPYPIHNMPAFSSISKWTNLEITEKIATRIISLPMFPELSENNQNKVIEAIKEFEKNN